MRTIKSGSEPSRKASTLFFADYLGEQPWDMMGDGRGLITMNLRSTTRLSLSQALSMAPIALSGYVGSARPVYSEQS
jgi:hypothetical protein